jgi:hypothetical protein
MLVALLLALLVPILANGQAEEKLARAGTSKSFDAPNDLKVTVRVSKPQDQEADVLFLCVFRQSQFILAIQDFDDALGGLISTVRKRGEFRGDELETILISNPPKKSMAAKQLMLIGLGEKDKQTPQLMRRIGTATLREAVRIGAKRAAFAAALIDQGSPKLKVEDVGYEVLQGAMLAFDTEKRLHNEGLVSAPALEEWVYLAGPEYYYHVAPMAGASVTAAAAAVKSRSSEPYVKPK